mmetsp:Transcript_6054/g.20661  ORF Transcript_6054/g.20661 Transcript_6054/m.20661 type:complete len:410 (-) Transcript_6054:46-1275(-)
MPGSVAYTRSRLGRLGFIRQGLQVAEVHGHQRARGEFEGLLLRPRFIQGGSLPLRAVPLRVGGLVQNGHLRIARGTRAALLALVRLLVVRSVRGGGVRHVGHGGACLLCRLGLGRIGRVHSRSARLVRVGCSLLLGLVHLRKVNGLRRSSARLLRVRRTHRLCELRLWRVRLLLSRLVRCVVVVDAVHEALGRVLLLHHCRGLRELLALPVVGERQQPRRVVASGRALRMRRPDAPTERHEPGRGDRAIGPHPRADIPLAEEKHTAREQDRRGQHHQHGDDKGAHGQGAQQRRGREQDHGDGRRVSLDEVLRASGERRVARGGVHVDDHLPHDARVAWQVRPGRLDGEGDPGSRQDGKAAEEAQAQDEARGHHERRHDDCAAAHDECGQPVVLAQARHALRRFQHRLER